MGLMDSRIQMLRHRHTPDQINGIVCGKLVNQKKDELSFSAMKAREHDSGRGSQGLERYKSYSRKIAGLHEGVDAALSRREIERGRQGGRGECEE